MSSKPTVTACLLNYQRPSNFGILLRCLRDQEGVDLTVALWDNARKKLAPPVPVDLHIHCPQNLECRPRWWLAAAAETDYVLTLDDDIRLTDTTVVRDAIDAVREDCRDGIVGIFGWSPATGDSSYRRGQHMRATPEADQRPEVVKGRFMVMRRAVLERVPLGLPWWGEDDIVASVSVGGPHLLPRTLAGRWADLPFHGVGRERRPGHWTSRTRAYYHTKDWMEAHGC